MTGEIELELTESYVAKLLGSFDIPYETDPQLKDTPRRVAKMYWDELLRGYWEDPPKLVTFPNGGEYDELICKKDIATFSLCAHHMLPFYGKTHIAYIPHEKVLDSVLGISKLARAVEHFARRLQTQENLTQQVGRFLVEHVSPHIAVTTEMSHLCERMRGVEKQETSLTCMFIHGVFKEQATARQEYLAHIYGRR